MFLVWLKQVFCNHTNRTEQWNLNEDGSEKTLRYSRCDECGKQLFPKRR